jgi:hypothetical protein
VYKIGNIRRRRKKSAAGDFFFQMYSFVLFFNFNILIKITNFVNNELGILCCDVCMLWSNYLSHKIRWFQTVCSSEKSKHGKQYVQPICFIATSQPWMPFISVHLKGASTLFGFGFHTSKCSHWLSIFDNLIFFFKWSGRKRFYQNSFYNVITFISFHFYVYKKIYQLTPRSLMKWERYRNQI